MRPLTGRQELLRYAIASVPLALIGFGWVFLVAQGFAEWPMGALDVALGVVGLILLRWRRRLPFTIAVVTAVLTTWSGSATGAASVALVSLATHRDVRRVAVACVVQWFAFIGTSFVDDGWEWGDATLVAGIGGAVTIACLVGFGLYLRSTRDLALSEERRREGERRDGLERARAGERARIAREMHDVLAHRLSILSLHAGALAHRTDLTADEVRQAAAIIRDNAHASLEELRGTLGSLREEDPLGGPQPSFGDLAALVSEVREAGQRVEYRAALEQVEQLPPQVGRHVYRIVQEALTNARKHAPGAPVTVELSGACGTSVEVRVTNVAGSPGELPVSSDGLGLIGLGERAALLGGTLTHHNDGDRFVVEASLPWSVTA
ncbi:Signal transduction histidine kinase [Promicromonospora umidemergens]|uniref:histidine kinase n=1 Tax=Promicromonospora umidemergens TaxID=629679 RepID=A0ABP8WKH3_9MICO|nr:histidine kinase [Promicromonospora umidemergens]MCP2283801.1 Signal transduction histidine kinase [Promicromonospora umidemergens]